MEINYKIYNKKMLVIISGLENWRYLLEGAKSRFKVWIDHKNLEYYKGIKIEQKTSKISVMFVKI